MAAGGKEHIVSLKPISYTFSSFWADLDMRLAAHLSRGALKPVTNLVKAFARVAARRRPLLWPVEQSLPVAGIDVLQAQSVLFVLRQSLTSPEGVQATEAWLMSLQLSQTMFDRLVHDLRAVQRNLVFWRERMRAGSHGIFMLLARGPIQFTADVLAALKLIRPRGSATDRIEERTLALQALSARLAAAISVVNKAADKLRLEQQDAAEVVEPTALLHATRKAIHACLADILRELGELASDEVAQLEDAPRLPPAALSLSGSMRIRPRPVVNGGDANGDVPAGGTQQLPTAEQIAEQLTALQQRLGLQNMVPARDAKLALTCASIAAAQLDPVVGVPRWARMPSRLERHWIRYTLASGVSISTAGFLYRHSRLAGSDDLERWSRSAVNALLGSWQAHIVQPLLVVRDELFKTFRDRPSIVSIQEFEADKQSLLRMLAEFEADHARKIGSKPAALPAFPAAKPSASTSSSIDSSSASASTSADTPPAQQDAINAGMSTVMTNYERELKSPIRHLIAGDLGRTLLIQVQRLKVDMEAAMLELDQILRANELSIALVAAIPSLLVAAALLRALARLLSPTPPDPKREAVPVRLAMVELERAFLTAAQRPLEEADGMAVYKVHKVWRAASQAYQYRDRTSRFSEWPHLQADLLQLARPSLSLQMRLELHRRIMRDYAIFQP